MSRYLEILRTPRVTGALLSTLLARLPIGINGLAILLFVREVSGSFGAAGLVTGAYALGAAVGAPIQGRLVDRYGRGVLVTMAGGHTLGLATLWATGEAAAATGLLVAAALAAGVTFPPSSSVLRSLWPVLLRSRPDLISSAYALDSVVIQVVFIAGPLLTAGVVALFGPQYALAVSAAAVLVGTSSFTLGLRSLEDERRAARPGALGALASPGIRTLALAMLGVGTCLGATEVGLPAFSEETGSAELAGVLIAVWSAASATGGLIYGARPRRAALERLHVRFALLFPLGYLPLALATSPAVMALLLIPAGAMVAPLIATRNELVGTVAPAGSTTEAFTWPLTALVAGISIGASVAGSVIDEAGWSAGLLVAAGGAAIGAAIIYGRRATLARPVAA